MLLTKSKLKLIKPEENSDYKMPTKVYFGRGGFSELAGILDKSKCIRVGLIAASHFKRRAEYQDFIKNLSNATPFDYPERIITSDFKTINEATSFMRENKVDCIIAIGGGSVLDTAKCVAALAKNDGLIEGYLQSKTKSLNGKGAFFIAVPTTSGTGSEVTPWATVWGSDDKKYSLSSSEFLFPDVALVDPALTDSLPAYETATSGIDALCQAIEAFWNVKHNPVSDSYALESIRVIIENLEAAVNNPVPSVRDEMAWGSLASGLAFSNTQTTLCHSVSYPITIHWGVAHGQATSITLPLFIEYIVPVLDKDRREKLLKKIGSKTEHEAAEKIKNLMRAINLKTRLSELGVPKDGLDTIITEGFNPERAKNSPRISTPDEFKKMLETIY